MGRLARMLVVAWLAAGCLDSPGSAKDEIDASPGEPDGGTDAGDPANTTEWQIPLGLSLPNVAIVDGALVVAAGFTGTVDLDPPITGASGSSDLLLAGFDADSTQQFAVAYGGDADELPTAVTVSPANGDIAVVGRYGASIGNVGGSDMPAPAGLTTMFVARYDQQGKHIWSQPGVSTAAVGAPFALSMSGSGTVAVTGEYAADLEVGIMQVTFDGPQADVYVARLGSGGSTLAMSGYGAAGVQGGAGAVYDGLGGIYLFGTQTGSFSIDEFTAEAGAAGGMFVCHLDEGLSDAGWLIDSLGGQVGGLRGAAMADGSLLVAGSFRDTFKLDVSNQVDLISRGGDDVFIAIVQPDGSVPWVEQLGGPGDDEARGIAVGPDGHFAVTGIFRGDVALSDGGTLLSSNGNGDIFLLAFEADRSLRWARGFGDGADDLGYSVAVDAGGAVVLGAVYRGEVDFGGDEPLVSEAATGGAVVRFR